MPGKSDSQLLDEGFEWVVKSAISHTFLFSAHHFARLSRILEQSSNTPDLIVLQQHRGLVIGAIFASVAFMEATINEFYDGEGRVPGAGDRVTAELSVRLRAEWEKEDFRRSKETLEKYDTVLRIAELQRLEQGREPYQSAKLLIRLRNALVHFKPEWSPIRARPGLTIPLDRLGKNLQGKFDENRWPAKCSGPAESPEPRSVNLPYFPDRCLGSGCAFWAADTARAFADEFFRRLDATWIYHIYIPWFDQLPGGTETVELPKR